MRPSCAFIRLSLGLRRTRRMSSEVVERMEHTKAVLAVFAVAVLMLTPGCSAPVVSPCSPSVVPSFGPMLHATVQIKTFKEDGSGIASGSGIVVGMGIYNPVSSARAKKTGTRILTAKHLLEGEGLTTLRVYQGDRVLAAVPEQLGLGSEADWMTLICDGVIGRAIPLVSGYGHVTPFEPCAVMGHPLTIATPTLTEGRIQAVESWGIRISAPIIFGNSGGGLYVVREGQWVLAGVTVGIYATGYGIPITHMGLCVDVRSILAQGAELN